MEKFKKWLFKKAGKNWHESSHDICFCPDLLKYDVLIHFFIKRKKCTILIQTAAAFADRPLHKLS